MKLYLAGNFAIMGNHDEEQKFRDTLGEDYFRLCAFYYEKEANIVMDIKEKEQGSYEEKPNKKKRIIKGSRKSKTRNRRKRNS